MNRVDDEVAANQDDRDAHKQRNKKDWHYKLLSFGASLTGDWLCSSAEQSSRTSPHRDYQLPNGAERKNVGVDT